MYQKADRILYCGNARNMASNIKKSHLLGVPILETFTAIISV